MSLETPRETKRQHFVPQVLVRMFRSRGSGQKARAWEFARGRSPREPLVRDIGHANRFYGPGVRGSLEHALGRPESAAGAALKRIAETQLLEGADLRTLLEFIATLTVRTRYLRAGMENEWTWVLRLTQATLSEPQSLARMITKGLADQRQLRGAMRLGVSSLPLPSGASDKLMLERQLYERARAVAPDQVDSAQLGSLLQTFMSHIEAAGLDGDLAGAAQRQAMQRELVPDARLRLLSELEWRLEVGGPATFVLGDCGPVAKLDTGELYRTFLAVGAAARVVVMPVAHNLALVGTGKGVGFELDAPELNRAMASNSHDFFVSSTNGETEKALHVELGSQSSIVREEEREGVAAHLREFISRDRSDAGSPSEVAQRAFPLDVAVIDETGEDAESVFIPELRGILWSWTEAAGADRVLVEAPAQFYVRVVPSLEASLAARYPDRPWTPEQGGELIWFEEKGTDPEPAFELLIDGRRLNGRGNDGPLRVQLARAVLWHLMYVMQSARSDEANRFDRRELPFARDQVHCLGNRFLRNLRLARRTRDVFGLIASEAVTVTTADGALLPPSEAWAGDDTLRLLAQFRKLVAVLSEVAAGVWGNGGEGIDHLLESSRTFLDATALAFGAWTDDAAARARRNAVLSAEPEFMNAVGVAWVDELVERPTGDHFERVDLVSSLLESLWARFGIYLADRGSGRWELLVAQEPA